MSFVATTQWTTGGLIDWVKFDPKGHTHLVRYALKLVPPTCILPLAKIKEEMFKYLLEVLNNTGPKADFFAARTVLKVRKRARKCKGKEGQSGDAMAVTPPPPAPPTGPVPAPPLPASAGEVGPPSGEQGLTSPRSSLRPHSGGSLGLSQIFFG
jgi:hypothetical protein